MGEPLPSSSRALIAAYKENPSLPPSLPTIFFEIKQVIDDPHSSFTRIGEVIGKDQALTARLLKLGNSALFGFPQRIDTITEAVSVIGLQQIRDLTLCTKVIEMFEGIPPDLIDIDSFWHHCIGTGIAARVLASHQRVPNIERYFVAGLLHDIGRLVLCLQLPEQMECIFNRARDEREFLFKVEQEVLGYDHAEVGAMLLASWEIPEALSGAIAYHHRPTTAPVFQAETALVHVADIFAHAMELGDSGEYLVPSLSSEAWKRVDIRPTAFSAVLKEVDRQFLDVIGILLSSRGS